MPDHRPVTSAALPDPVGPYVPGMIFDRLVFFKSPSFAYFGELHRLPPLGIGYFDWLGFHKPILS